MRKLFILILLGPAVLWGDAVWEYPFTELNAQWNYGSGWTGVAGGLEFEKSMYGKCDPGDDADFQTTVFLDFPAGCDSMTVSMGTGFLHTGYTMDGGVNVSMIIQVDPFTSDVVIFNEYDNHSSPGYVSFNVSDSTDVSGTVTLTSALEGRILFRASMSGYGYMWATDLHWTMWDMTVTGHGVTRLERDTWGSIKTLL
ncbi:MAG: hypothetical protein AVO35_10330 [Candidatus Aegiribacteria sp. MLS_C]|nr:MAG: hypothetical protein AVO35_10330 [Candidatus Aegiribacteria sp. MLS_C]